MAGSPGRHVRGSVGVSVWLVGGLWQRKGRHMNRYKLSSIELYTLYIQCNRYMYMYNHVHTFVDVLLTQVEGKED